MRKMFYTLTLAAITNGALADHSTSDLLLQTFNGSPIKVYVDNRLVTFQPQRSVFITNLIPGRHFIRVESSDFNRYGQFGHRGHDRVLFQGNVFIEEGSEIHAEIDRSGRLRITGVIQRFFEERFDPYDRDFRPSDRDQRHDHSRAVISDREFQDIRAMVRNTSFESTKLTVAQRAIAARWITTMQVRQMLDLFSFESTKLQFAKEAFHSVTDKERFYLVFDAFSFSSSVHELDRFIRQQGY